MKDIKIGDGLMVRCETAVEEWRALGFETKEPGTVAWLRAEVRPDDVFYDIGANIGLYSLLAASLGAKVYAFEPHVANAASLIRQVAANRLGSKIMILTMALDHRAALQPFNYGSKMAGSSGSQLGHTTDEAGAEFVPVGVELKQTTTVDLLVQRGELPAPTLMKLDVDGNEMAILTGAASTLRYDGPRSAQVEVHASDHDQIIGLMAGFGYSSRERHDTEMGAKRIADGADKATITHNLIFRRNI